MPIGDKNIDRIKGNVKLMIDKGAPDGDIDGYLSEEGVGINDLNALPSPQKEEPAQWKKNVASVGDYVLPAAGAIGAEVLASPATVASGPFAPATAVAAGTAGYMAGKSGARGLRQLLGLQEDKGLVEEAKTSLTQDLPEGAIGGMGGGIAIKGAKEAGRYGVKKLANTKIPERLWTSAAKPSMGGKLSIKDRRVGTALKEGITPDRQGLETANVTIDSLNAEVDSIVANAAKQGKVLDRTEVLNKLYELKNFYAKAQNPSKYINPINEAAATFSKNVPSKIPINKAQNIKQTTYAIHKKAYNPNVTPGVDTEAEQKIAQGLKEGIEGAAPEVGPLNRREGDLIDLLKIVEPAVSRVENSNVIGLGTPMTSAVGGAVGGPAGALGAGVAKAIAEDPSNKAKLAIWLAGKRGENLTKIGSPYVNLENLLMGRGK